MVSYQIMWRTLQRLKCCIRARKQHESRVWEIWVRLKGRSQKHREWGPKQGQNGHHRDVDTVASINFERKPNTQFYRLGQCDKEGKSESWTMIRLDYLEQYGGAKASKKGTHNSINHWEGECGHIEKWGNHQILSLATLNALKWWKVSWFTCCGILVSVSYYFFLW